MSEPWQAAQVALPTWPKKTCRPRFSCAVKFAKPLVTPRSYLDCAETMERTNWARALEMRSAVTSGEILPQVQAGQVRLLATLMGKRVPELPEVPTVRELGFNWDLNSWLGIAGPPNMPAELVTQLEQAFIAGMKDPAFQKSMKDLAVAEVTAGDEETAVAEVTAAAEGVAGDAEAEFSAGIATKKDTYRVTARTKKDKESKRRKSFCGV